MPDLLLDVDEELAVLTEALGQLLARKRVLETARRDLRLGRDEAVVAAEIKAAERRIGGGG